MKRILMILSMIAIIATGSIALAACNMSAPNTLTADAAKLIAVNDLGTDINSANFSGVTTKVKDGVTYFDIEFMLNGIKYEYRINSATSAIHKIEINDQTVVVGEKPVLPTSPEGAELYITRDEAKAIAFADAAIGSDAEVTRMDIGFDYDDGMYLYEIEFRKTATDEKFEYEIKAAKADNGAIYKKEVNNINIIEPTPPSVDYIGMDGAKEIAYANAEVDASNVVLKKAKFEVDNGVHVYEIEFTVNGVEYEYEINAITGAVIEKEVGGSPTTPPQTGNYIGIDAAKLAALTHAGFTAEQVTRLSAKLEIERGIYVYEVEFRFGGNEYEYEINATTAAIISVDK